MTIFNAPKNQRIADAISITSPSSFKKSIQILSVGGLSGKEKAALVLAQTRAKLQLKRKNLSDKERYEFTEIVREKIEMDKKHINMKEVKNGTHIKGS